MKTLIISIIALTASNICAQQIANGDCETWTISGGSSPDGEYLTGWATVNNTIPNAQAWLLNQTCYQSTDVHSGSYAVELETQPPPFSGYPNVNGITTNGTINETTYAVESGVAYSLRPDSLVGWFKASPMGSDFATIEFLVKSSSEDTIGWARFEAPNATVSNYTRFSVPVVYNNGNTPDLAVVLLSASDGFNSVVGSKLWVDDLELIFNSVGVSENQLEALKVHASMNQITIDLPDNANGFNYELISATGQLVQSGKLNSNLNLVNANPSTGLYFVRVFSEAEQKTVKIFLNN